MGRPGSGRVGAAPLARQAGDEIDADQNDWCGQGQRRALMVRHLIERLCTDSLDRFGRATGPPPLAFSMRLSLSVMPS